MQNDLICVLAFLTATFLLSCVMLFILQQLGKLAEKIFTWIKGACLKELGGSYDNQKSN